MSEVEEVEVEVFDGVGVAGKSPSGWRRVATILASWQRGDAG